MTTTWSDVVSWTKTEWESFLILCSLCFILLNDLCTRMESLGRLNAMAAWQLTVKIPVMRKTRVASYISLVEAFAIKMKMESSSQHPSKELIDNQDELQMPKTKGSMTPKRHIYLFGLWTTVNQLINGSRRGQPRYPVQILSILKISWFQPQTLQKVTYHCSLLDKP